MRSKYNKDYSKRIGEIGYSNCGDAMKIIEYNSAIDILVEFQDNFKCVKRTSYKNFKCGDVKNNFRPSVSNIGYIGYTTIKENGKLKRSYSVWRAMIERCYEERVHKIEPSYKECIVCDHWLNYANFEEWYKRNYYEVPNKRMELDKDVLIKGNKIYSQNTCIFVPKDINTILATRRSNIGTSRYVGVTREGLKYKATCGMNGKTKSIGRYKTEEEAFEKYKECKEKFVRGKAIEYKEHIPVALYEALINYTVDCPLIECEECVK